jgi:hypothetical protein
VTGRLEWETATVTHYLITKFENPLRCALDKGEIKKKVSRSLPQYNEHNSSELAQSMTVCYRLPTNLLNLPPLMVGATRSG